jgi:hypothetical protein
MYLKELMTFNITLYDLDPPTLELLAQAIRKVHRHRAELARER